MNVTGDSGGNAVPGVESVCNVLKISLEEVERMMQAASARACNLQDLYALSPLQEGILFDSLVNRRKDTYIILTCFECRTRVVAESLVNAIQFSIDRHDILRTGVFWEERTRAVQVVYRSATLPVEVVSHIDGDDPIEQIKEHASRALPGWDLRKAPLMKFWLGEDRKKQCWYGVLQAHHLICDHESTQLLLAEVAASVANVGQILPPAAPYRAYVEQLLANGTSPHAEAFFREKLGDFDESSAPFGLLDLSADRIRREHRQELDPLLLRSIRAQALRARVSVTRLLHAAWALVVARTSGRDDVVYGTVAQTGTLLSKSARASRALGPAVNTLAMRLRLKDLTAKELVEYVARELDELLNFNRFPLALAKRCSGIDARVPLMTALLNCLRKGETGVSESLAAAGIGHLGTVTASTNYPITVSVIDANTSMELVAQTDERIDPRRLTGYFITSVRSLVNALQANPSKAAVTLPILTEDEEHLVVCTFNETGQSCRQDKLIHQLFDEQAELTPNALAVLQGDEAVTYGELRHRANLLAAHLKRLGVVEGDLVAVHLGRGPMMVIAILAVLKSGAAYVPLDPSYPPERLRFMLDDSGARVMLTEERLRVAISDARVHLVEIDALHNLTPGLEDMHALDDGGGARLLHRLYVIYTSGTTGRPKGIEMSHGAMLNLIEWHRQHFSAVQKRVLQFAPLSFDVAFQEIFSTLCTGGTLVLLEEWVRRDPHALIELLRDCRVNRVFMPPLVLHSLTEFANATNGQLPDLQDVVVAGEQLRISAGVVGLMKCLKECRLHNHYGPTETHVVTALTLAGDPEKWPDMPPIGRPIQNTQIYILDGQMQPVPLGVSGEVYIGGANVARGYLKRAELTAQRFVASPFSREGGARLYKTGDLGRWLTDGSIEYVGRNDGQVKVRGFRIELGEVEAQLARHVDVQEVAIVAREELAGEKRLIAYVTLRARSMARSEDLRAYLSEVLPQYMVPSAYVIMERLPVTPSGKLDRRSLPAPGIDAYTDRAYEPVQGVHEQFLADVWRELLGVEQVSRQDSFYEIGGDSITAMRLSAIVSQRYGVPLPVHTILSSPKLRNLAQVLGSASTRALDSQMEEITL